jgi:8-amino-7-oxononanoate synthase
MTSAFDKIIDTTMGEHRRAHIHEMFKQMNQYNVVAREIRGRHIRTSDSHWVIDFASCNYLGLDLHPQMQDWIDSSIKKWGVHPSWCRLVASPSIYSEVEEKLADLVGTEATLILPTVTLISIGIIPVLVGKTGLLILDKTAHETMYEAAKIARDSGAILKSYEHEDYARLEELLVEHRDNPRKVIMVDGVYSMSGDYAHLERLQALASKHDAIVYIDDAHGFGVVGERPDKKLPYGYRGSGIVRHSGCSYDNLLYVGGCSKAYSSLAAFVACSHKMKKFIQAFATPYDLSGPCPTASLATLNRGLEINDKEGDALRSRLWNLVERGKEGLKKLGFKVMNTTGFPIVAVVIGDQELLIETANLLFDEGILVTVAPFPMVKRGDESHRLSFTAANTEEDVDRLLAAFKKVRERLPSNYGQKA